MHQLKHLPGRTVQIDNEPWLYFSGTGYLGAAWNEGLQNLVRAGMQQYGLHFGGSRLSNIQLNIFAEAEEFLANYAGAEKALLLSSGTLAGQLLMRVLSQYGEVLAAPGAHPAIWANAVPEVNTWESWVEKVKTIAQTPGPALVIAANSIDPLRVRRFDFAWLSTLSLQRELIVVIDDSHGFGLTGAEGSGIYRSLTLPPGAQLLVISSLGKALGIPAGVILGPKMWLERLWVSPYFGGASPPAPAYLLALVQGQSFYAESRQKLQANIQQFVQNLPELVDFHFFPEYPVFYTPNSGLAAFLSQRKILISSFPYPTPQDALVTRIVLSSLHTDGDISSLLESLHYYCQSEKS